MYYSFIPTLSGLETDDATFMIQASFRGSLLKFVAEINNDFGEITFLL